MLPLAVGLAVRLSVYAALLRPPMQPMVQAGFSTFTNHISRPTLIYLLPLSVQHHDITTIYDGGFGNLAAFGSHFARLRRMLGLLHQLIDLTPKRNPLPSHLLCATGSRQQLLEAPLVNFYSASHPTVTARDLPARHQPNTVGQKRTLG